MIIATDVSLRLTPHARAPLHWRLVTPRSHWPRTSAPPAQTQLPTARGQSRVRVALSTNPRTSCAGPSALPQGEFAARGPTVLPGRRLQSLPRRPTDGGFSTAGP